MGAPQGTYRCGVSERGPAARLFDYRDCVGLLAARALKVRYRRSVLGFGWTLALPLVSMTVLTVVFSRVFSGIDHYALYVVIGLLAWGFFSLSCIQAMDALLGASPIMKKVYVPPAVFPLASIGANLCNWLLSILVLPLVALLVGATPGFHPLWLAVAIVLMCMFTAGVALALAALNLLFHDVRYLFEAVLLIWFYATPIVYPAAVIPEPYSLLLWLNPFYWLLEMLRAPLWSGLAPEATTLLFSVGWAVLSLAGGWTLFSRLQSKFHLYM